MKSTTWTILMVATLTVGTDVRADSAKETLESAWAAQVGRWEGLDSYVVEQSVMGHSSNQYFVRTAVADSTGTTRTMFLPAPVGTESGCVKPLSGSHDSSSEADTAAEYMSWFLNNAELVGDDTVDGQAVLQFQADGLNQTQKMGEQQITMNSMNMWLSKGEYLPLKMRMNGIATVEGQERSVVVETLQQDFRTVAGSRLREPFKRVVNISGMLGGADTEQVAQARAQLAEFEKQMASMPASQREMMEGMIGPKLDVLRNLAETGGIETEITILSITPNPEVNGKRVVACDSTG